MLRTEYVTTVAELLARHESARPDRIAFIDDRRTITYGQLAATTARIAGHLQRIGVDVGDRVLLYLDDRVEVAECYLAAPRAGAVGVCVNPRAAAAEVEHILSDSDARVVITDEAHLPVLRELAGYSRLAAVVVVGSRDDGPRPVREIGYEQLLAAAASEPARDCLGLDDVAWMLYTSGTTGRPKGVHLTQRGCLWVVAACWAPIAGLGPDDVLLSALPLFHSYALVLCVLGVSAVGACARVLPRFSVTDVAARLTGGPEGDVTVLPGVPTMFHYLLAGIGAADLKAPGLRVCISAGAVMPATLNTGFETAFGVPLVDGYGITETSTMVTMNWLTGTRVMGSCGLPLPGLTVRLVDPVTLRDVPTGAEGEIWVNGPNVTPGYHNLPDATAEALVDGWYRTGDLARRDAHGFLRISGRTKELIIRGGENIHPAEIEEALLASEHVTDAAVVGVPHQYLGEVPVAFVVAARPGELDTAAVLETARALLSAFKLPSRVIEVDAIPRTGSGKVLRFQLSRRYADRVDGEGGSAAPVPSVS